MKCMGTSLRGAIIAFLLISSLATAQQWKQTNGQNAESNVQLTRTTGQPPQVWLEPAGYSSQSTMVTIPGIGACIWENYHHDINVFSNALFCYNWQNGAEPGVYPWGQPIFYCNTTQDTANQGTNWPVPNTKWVLASAINSTQTTIPINPAFTNTGIAAPISDTNAFPPTGSGGPVMIREDEEIMELQSVDTLLNLLHVVRGQWGTPAVAHANLNQWYGRFGYTCEHAYLGDGVSPPQALAPPTSFISRTAIGSVKITSGNPGTTKLVPILANTGVGDWVPAPRHPFASMAPDSTHGTVWLGGGFDEGKKGNDLWALCLTHTSEFCSQRPTLSFYTPTAPMRQDSVLIWDPDEQVLGDFGGSVNGANSKMFSMFAVGSNPLVGVVNPDQFNVITTGTTTTYVSNPTAGPALTAMRGVYDTNVHAFVLWGGTTCVTPTNLACQTGTSNKIYLLKWNATTSKWNWIIPVQKTSTGASCPASGSCPVADWRPAIVLDSTRNREIVAEPSPYNGTGGGGLYAGTWDGNTPGIWTWTNLNVAPHPNFNAYMSQVQCPSKGPAWGAYCLDYPYMTYIPEHDALLIMMNGKGNPQSIAAFELAF